MTLSIACPEGTVQGGGDQDRALGVLAAFRRELYRCFSKRPDGLAGLADAVLCKPDRVHMLAELSLVPECRRGHGAVYDALNSGRVQIGAAAAIAGGAAVPGLGGRPDPAGGRREQLAAAGRGRPARTGCSAIRTRAARGTRR